MQRILKTLLVVATFSAMCARADRPEPEVQERSEDVVRPCEQEIKGYQPDGTPLIGWIGTKGESYLCAANSPSFGKFMINSGCVKKG